MSVFSASTSSSKEPPVVTSEVSAGYRHYVLGLLLLVYVCNMIDRQILSILLEPIKKDLQLSDTSLGFLSGIAFALFYTIAGIPIARWADQRTRRPLIVVGLALWSGMTMFSGLAQSFLHLALARVGVGIGEAACTPPSHSLLSDYFPRERRGTALSIYSLGVPLGIMLGYMTGGWMNEFFGWRSAFFVVGLPGLILAVIVHFSLRELPRGYADGVPTPLQPHHDSLTQVFRFMWQLRSFRHMAAAAALSAICAYGQAVFAAPFLMRVHGMTSTGELGMWLGIIWGIAGGIGTFLGGTVADRLAGGREERWYLWLPATATLLVIPCAVLFYLWPEVRTALFLSIPLPALSIMYLGPTFAMAQGLVKPHMRATASAVLLFFINLFGLGLGPQLVGILSDALTPSYGIEAIRYALLIIVCVSSGWAVFHYLRAATTIRDDLRTKQSAETWA